MTQGFTRHLHFLDKRSPHQMTSAFEGEIRTLFVAAMEDDKLCMRSKAFLGGAEYSLLLRFESAMQSFNYYSLRMDVTWADSSSDYSDYYTKSSGSWFELWTRELVSTDLPKAGQGSLQLYHQLCEEAATAEKHLDSVAAIQIAIIAAMRRGASFRTAHKEGGTNISWKGDRFVRSDFGEYPGEQRFTVETEFLDMLRKFCHSDVTCHSGKDQLSEIDTWRLILRRIQS